MSDSGSARRNPAETVRDVLEAAAGAVETRAELLALEFQEERIKLVELLLLAGGMVGLTIATVGVVSIGIVLLFEGTTRLAAVAGLGACYAIGAGWCYRILLRRLKAYRPFAGTMDELRKDRECLRRKS